MPNEPKHGESFATLRFLFAGLLPSILVTGIPAAWMTYIAYSPADDSDEIYGLLFYSGLFSLLVIVVSPFYLYSFSAKHSAKKTIQSKSDIQNATSPFFIATTLWFINLVLGFGGCATLILLY